MNKGVIYYTKIREEYVGAHMEHMIAEKLLEIALKKEYGINLYNEPRAEGEHGKPFLSYRPFLHYNISHSGEYVVCILADQEVGIDVQIHRKANYERMLKRMVPEDEYNEILASADMQERFFEQWVLREAYIKWTGEGLSRDLRTISMNEGSSMLLDMEDGYSGAVWAMNPMEICWKFEDIILLG
jgi:4'-phosphopantetheinyl transferase